jgi:hypothetical protein
VLIEVLKGAKADPEYIAAARHFRCEDCSVVQKLPKQTSKVSAPKPYEFNHTVGVDVNNIIDTEGSSFQLMNIVCVGTSLQIEIPMQCAHGMPSSKLCLDTFMEQWVAHYGYPKVIRCDRGLHNRGVFYKEMDAAGVQVTNIGLETPYQIGKVEREGDVWKKIAKKVIEARGVAGFDQIKMMACEVNATKMDMSRVGGFAPSQWVLGRMPRRGPGEVADDEAFAQVGSQQARIDATSEFAKRMEFREAAKKAFVYVDSSRRVAKALLRKTAPLAGEYRVGDVVAFQRMQGSRTEESKWHAGSRIIGFDGKKTCWVINGGVPFCIAVDQLRPCSAAEALAYQYLHKDYNRPPQG